MWPPLPRGGSDGDMKRLQLNSEMNALAAANSAQAAQTVFVSQPSSTFFHFDFRRSLQMHKGLAVGIFGLVLLVTLAYAAKTWNNYFAESIVYVQPAPPKLMDNGPVNRWPYDANTYESYIQQQIHNVTRPDVLLNASRKIPDWAFTGETPQAAAERLGRKIEVNRVGAGYQLSIRARSKDVQRAAVIANAVAASFIESATRELRAGDAQRIEILREERDRIQKELAADRTEQEDLNKKLGFAAVSGAIPDPIDEQISAVRGELVKARTDNDVAAARLTAETRGRGASSALDAEAEQLAANDAGLVSMKSALNKRRSDLISQMANLTPAHPLYQQDSEELAHINDSLDKMGREVHARAAQQIEQKLKADLDRTAAVESKLNANLAQLTASAGTATPRLQRFNDLTTDIQRLQQRFSVIEEQFRNLTLENNAPGAVYLSAAATPPLGADRAKALRLCLILIVVGLVFAVGAALVAQNLDKRVYTATDVERVLGFAPMAQLPDFYEVGTGVSEEYLLRLAAAVEHSHQQGELKSCIFTAAAPGAGATTVVKRVTGILEAMGRQTVLVESAAPSAPPAESSATGRDLVPTRGSRSTALLQQMSEEMDDETVVLTDTAPLLVSGETEYLARFVDSAIVVLESGVSTRDQLRRIAETLQRLEVRSVGFVLNRISLETADAAFRESVQAVERHVAAQTRNFAQGTEPAPPAAPEPEAAHQSAASEPVFAAELKRSFAEEPVVARQSPAASAEMPREPRPEPQPARAHSATVDVEPMVPPIAPVESQPGYVKPGGSPLPRGRKVHEAPAVAMASTPAASASRPDIPARGSEFVPPTPSSPLTTAPEPPVGQRHAADVPNAFKVPAAQTKISPAQAQKQDRPAAASFVAASAGPIAAPIDPFIAARMASAEAPRGPAAANPPAGTAGDALVTAGASQQSIADDLPYSAASRLGGLRNLLVTLGLKTLNNDAEMRGVDTAVDRPSERPVYAEPYRPSAPASAEQGAAHSVTANPEFLPPRTVAEPAEAESEQVRAIKQPRLARTDNYDDIETLPSWRGQYRKRR